MRWDAIRGSRAIARRAHTQEFEDFGIGDLRFSIGLVGIDHVVRDAERLGKFVNGNPTRVLSLPACGKLLVQPIFSAPSRRAAARCLAESLAPRRHAKNALHSTTSSGEQGVYSTPSLSR